MIEKLALPSIFDASLTSFIIIIVVVVVVVVA